jgi:hypothetical protein
MSVIGDKFGKITGSLNGKGKFIVIAGVTILTLSFFGYRALNSPSLESSLDESTRLPAATQTSYDAFQSTQSIDEVTQGEMRVKLINYFNKNNLQNASLQDAINYFTDSSRNLDEKGLGWRFAEIRNDLAYRMGGELGYIIGETGNEKPLSNYYGIDNGQIDQLVLDLSTVDEQGGIVPINPMDVPLYELLSVDGYINFLQNTVTVSELNFSE